MYSSFVRGDLGAENEAFEVEKLHFSAETLISPFGPLWENDEGECFAPYDLKYAQILSFIFRMILADLGCDQKNIICP